MIPHHQMQERLDRQTEDRLWSEHRKAEAARARQIAEQRVQDDLGLLRPGERIIDGKVMYSSMWLDDRDACTCGHDRRVHLEGRHNDYGRCADCEGCGRFRLAKDPPMVPLSLDRIHAERRNASDD